MVRKRQVDTALLYPYRTKCARLLTFQEAILEMVGSLFCI